MKNLLSKCLSIFIASAIFLSATVSLLLAPIHLNGPAIDIPAGDLDNPSTDLDSDFSDSETEPPQDNTQDDANQDSSTDSSEESEPEHTPVANYARSKVNGLNLRSGPGTKYSSVGYLDAGDMVVLLGKNGDWYLTVYKNKTAYISASELFVDAYSLPASGKSLVEDVIKHGLQLLGFPYVYGAIRFHDGNGRKLNNFDPTKYDCSSLMQYIFYHGANIHLNMTTRTQVTQGVHVPKNNLQRGDLIFFTNSSRYYKTGIERIGHVALYLGGNYILHTASDFAVIEEISTQRWKYYIEARRFI